MYSKHRYATNSPNWWYWFIAGMVTLVVAGIAFIIVYAVPKSLRGVAFLICAIIAGILYIGMIT